MRTKLTVLLLLLTAPVMAQEKSCPVENANLYIVKQARDAAERRSAELAVRLEQALKEKKELEKQVEKKAGE